MVRNLLDAGLTAGSPLVVVMAKLKLKLKFYFSRGFKFDSGNI
jgi:hypothetical protein